MQLQNLLSSQNRRTPTSPPCVLTDAVSLRIDMLVSPLVTKNEPKLNSSTHNNKRRTRKVNVSVRSRSRTIRTCFRLFRFAFK